MTMDEAAAKREGKEGEGGDWEKGRQLGVFSSGGMQPEINMVFGNNVSLLNKHCSPTSVFETSLSVEKRNHEHIAKGMKHCKQATTTCEWLC